MEHSASGAFDPTGPAAAAVRPSPRLTPPSRPGSPPKMAGAVPNGKRKREKYTEKACGPCKVRKIKCGGGTPCAACIRRKRPCVVSESDNPIRRGHSVTDLGGGDSTDPELVKTLQSRMATLESHLTVLNQALLRVIPSVSKETNLDHFTVDDLSQEIVSEDVAVAAGYRTKSMSNSSGASPRDGLTFTSGKSLASKNQAGATSMLHALRRVEDRLTELGLPIVEERDAAPETPPMTPLASSSRNLSSACSSRELPYLLQKHSIAPDRDEWNLYLGTFMVEVHPLYPFFTEESIRQMYDQLWRCIRIEDTGSSSNDADADTDQVVQTLLILANGRCATSSRIQSNDGSSSAGWGLYCIAMEMQGNLLDTVSDDSNPMSSLQTLTLVVIYLLRLDATERAQKILSLAIMHAHHLGIHLKTTHTDMPKPQSELFKRVWWCLYVLDRRIALVLGRPFIVYDSNIEIGLNEEPDVQTPTDSGNCRSGNQQPDLDALKHSPVHYLNVMVGYSRVVGKVWEALFGAESREHANPHIHEYLESLVHDWMGSVPPFLISDTDHIHRSSFALSPALFKQRFLVRLRYLNILNVVRSPIRLTKSRTTLVFHNNTEAETICLQRARCIVDMFGQCSLADGVYGFPFLPYLLEATILILACLTRLPSLKPLYKDTVDMAITMLKTLYRKTWVSGKVARMIFKLGNIIPQVFSCDTTVQVSPPPNATRRWEPMTRDSDESAPSTIGSSTEALQIPGASVFLHEGTIHGIPETGFSPTTATSNHASYHQYQPSASNRQELVDEKTAAPDFGFEDFPFELNFGIAIPQTSLLPDYNGDSNGNAIEGLAGQSFVGYDVDWLQELIALDSRHIKFA